MSQRTSVGGSDGETEAIGAPADSLPAEAVASVRLDRYVVLEEIGRGGMGIVVRAYDPKLQREVALKRVRTDVGDPAAQARLVREARAMARLNHPNVVAVYDVELPDHAHGDEAIVVMEYVAGVTAREWLSKSTHGWRETVNALVEAGRGLAAAHAVGLLHRDFKLDNILVTSPSGPDDLQGRARIRVTDFGLARASDSQVRPDESFAGAAASNDDVVDDQVTRAGTVVGTAAYMAPEQSRDDKLDARVDQYAFCVALWRALTQKYPFEGRGAALVHAKRAGPPKWPRDVVAPSHIVAAIRRGLAPEPADRWPNMSALLVELSRDPSRRGRRLIAAAVVAVAALGAWELRHLQDERARATCATEGARLELVWNEARADEIATAFAASGVEYAPDTWSRARTRIDAYVAQWNATRTEVCERVDVDETLPVATGEGARACLDEQHDRLAALLDELAEPDAVAIQRAGTAASSLPLARICVDDTALRHYDREPPDPTTRERARMLRFNLARAAAALAAGRPERALEQAEAAHAGAKELGWEPLVVEAGTAMGLAKERLGRYEDARADLEAAFLSAGAIGRDDLALRAGTHLVNVVGARLARYEEGLQWGRLSSMLVDRLDLRADDPAVGRVHATIGLVHKSRGAYAEAKAEFTQALAIHEAALGPDHLDVAAFLVNLANAHTLLSDHAEAGAAYERVLAIREHALGPEHPEVAMSLSNLGVLRLHEGKTAEARELLLRAVPTLERALGPDHPEVASAVTNLGLVYQAEGEYAEAEAAFERALAVREKTLDPDHPELARAVGNLATVQVLRGARAAARVSYERVLAMLERSVGPEHPDVAMTLNNFAIMRAQDGESEEALAMLERAIAISEKALGPDHPDTALALHSAGDVHRAAGSYELALPYYERALAIREREGLSALDAARTRRAVAEVSWLAGGDRSRAIALMTAARDAFREAHDDASTQVADAWLAAHPITRRAG